MDYEIMMNGNVKIGMQAPNFEADTTMGKLGVNAMRLKVNIKTYSSTSK